LRWFATIQNVIVLIVPAINVAAMEVNNVIVSLLIKLVVVTANKNNQFFNNYE